MNNTANKIKNIYYKIFFENFYTFYHTHHCTYEFLKITDYKFFNVSGKSYFSGVKNNLFLADYDVNKIALGKNILSKGLYFPFYLLKDTEENEKNILLGKHRIYSLLCLPNKIIDKKFLFITIPFDNSAQLIRSKNLLDIPTKLTICKRFSEDIVEKEILFEKEALFN